MSGTAASDPAQSVAERLAGIRRRIERAGADPAEVAILAVTKGFGPEVLDRALAAGLSDVGENYAQELLAKADGSSRPLRWHFIGRLQRNKIRMLAPLVHLWQSVDRVEVGSEIARHAPGAAVLVQVDVAGEPQQGGCPPEKVPGLVAELAGLGLDVRGLMAIGPIGDAEASRAGFRRVAQLADDLHLELRSMGMSADLDVAVSEGSNLLRIGTALFGSRPGRKGVQG